MHNFLRQRPRNILRAIAQRLDRSARYAWERRQRRRRVGAAVCIWCRGGGRLLGLQPLPRCTKEAQYIAKVRKAYLVSETEARSRHFIRHIGSLEDKQTLLLPRLIIQEHSVLKSGARQDAGPGLERDIKMQRRAARGDIHGRLPGFSTFAAVAAVE